MNKNMICPICSGSCPLFDVVDFNKSCEEIKGKFLSLAGIPVYYARCGTCGFCFAPELASWEPEEFSEKIYNDKYIIVDPDYIEVRPRVNATNLIAMFGEQIHSIKHLDYGGGAGLLAKLLRKSDWNSTSYDPFVDKDMSTEQLGKFDLITAFEVFEHVPNVPELMSNLRALLAQDGLILFSTLLSDGNIHPDKRLNWWYASPRNGHISLFSRNSLSILAQKNGFNFGSFNVGFHAFFTKLPPWATHLEKLTAADLPPQQPEPQTLEQTLRQAIMFHQAGQLQEAGELYLSILQTQPNHPEANYNMGMLAVQANLPAAGLPYFSAALDADPAHGQYWISYIDALLQAGQLEDARQILALAKQQGLEGDDVEALALRIENGAIISKQPNAEFQHAPEESSPVPPAIPETSNNTLKAKPTLQEIDTLLSLFNEGRHNEVETLAKAMTLRFPLHEFGWKMLGAVLNQSGRHSDALAPMQKAAALAPGDEEVHYNLAITLQALNRLEEAATSYRKALQINPELAEAHYRLGDTLYIMGRHSEAETSYRHALEIKPHDAAVHSNLGANLDALDRPEEAEACYRRALQISPDNAETYNNLGITLQRLGRMGESEESLRRALEIKPDYAQAHCNLGATLYDMGRLDESSACYRRALEIKPDLAEAHNNLGNTLLDLGRLEEAEACCRRALEIKQDYPKAHHNLSLILLTMGRLSEGWPEYEYRWETNPARALTRPATLLPQWIGQTPLHADRLLVFKEQGLGDQLQLSRYLFLAANRFTNCANCVSVVVAPPLLTLFRRSFPDVEILDTVPADQSPWQWHCPMLSLPLAFDTKLDTIPNHVPYLTPDPARVSQWQSRITALALPTSSRKIGIVWKPGSGMKNASFRALALQQLGPLLDLPDCTWFSLQKESDPDKEPFVTSGKLVDWTDEFNDFDDTAALVANLDLVISVDTSVAHLAGGLGKPVWLFNRHASEWRWMRGHEDSPWYPTMRIFTQKTAGDWNEVVSRMAVVLQQASQPQEAGRLYLSILQTQPNHPEANYNMGTLAVQANLPAASLPYFSAALDADPAHGQYWISYIDALFQAGQLDDARQALTLAKQQGLEGDDVDALALRIEGSTTTTVPPNGHGNGAVPDDEFRHACFPLPCSLEGLLREVNVNTEFQHTPTESPPISAADPKTSNKNIKDQPSQQETNALIYLFGQGRFEEAVALAQSMAKNFPLHEFGWQVLAATFKQMGREADMLVPIQKLVALAPGDVGIHNSLGVTLHNLGRMEEAEASYRRALQLKPNYADAHYNLGKMFKDLNRPGEAEACYRRALEIKPDDAKAHHNLSLVLLTMGRLSEGWPEYEYRRETFLPKLLHTKTDLPQWKGQSPLPGDRLLVLREQGLGDQIQISRYLPLAASRFANCISIEVTPPLLTLFRRSFPEVEILDTDPADQSPWQWYCAMLSLPLAFNTTLETIPNQTPYLVPDPARVSYWQSKIAALNLPISTRKIGAVWKSGKMMKISYLKNLSIAQLLPLLDLSDCAWFSLQKEPDPDKEPFVTSGKLVDWTDEFNDFDDTAALVANLDLVISVDTSVAHLAGALGRPVWLFNRHASDWRWMQDREDSPWYPTMRIFTQRTAGDWDEVVSRMAVVLQQAGQPGEVRHLEVGTQTAAPPGATHGTAPSHQEIDALLALFGEERFTEAADLAQSMTERFPLHEFGWKALGAAFKQMGRNAEALTPMQKAAALAPEDEEAHYNLGVTLHQLGRLDEAETSYRRALQINPDYADAHSNLGVLLQDLDRLEEADASFRRALQINPDYADRLSNLGVAFYQSGRLHEAEASLSRALEAKPDDAQAHCNLGVTLHDMGRLDEASACYRMAIEINPDLAEAHNNLGITLHELGRMDEAERSLRRALEAKPDDAQAHCNLGVTLHDMGRLDEASACYRRAIEIKPDLAEAHNNLGNTLKDLNRLDEAKVCYQQAIQIKPDYAVAHYNLGTMFQDLNWQDKAEACFRRALEIKPDYANAHNNLGLLLNEMRQFDKAEACFRRALEIKPDNAEAYTNLGNCKLDLGQLDEAEACYRKALEIEPNYFIAHSNLLFSLNYASSKSPADCFSEALRYGKNIKSQVTTPFTEWSCVKHPERLRVGFVSGDFNNHPVGFFLENLLRQLDTTVIDFIAYPTSTKTDELTTRIKPLFSAWKSLFGLKDEAAAQLIHKDGVHILIDLSGHSSRNRLPVFAWKPAPVQVSWLGYFATTGVTEIDYLIADPWTLPESEEVYFTEKIWRLPETRLCFTPPDFDLEASALPALTNGYTTFCCFNNLTKINEEVVALWSRLLLSIPDSRLFLKARQLNEAAIRQHTIERFAKHGIKADRLILEGYETREKYLAAYQRADIALDPFPFPGGTTSVEGLWMGVPVLTLAGKRFLSRQGIGILMNAGLPDWVARDKEDYATLAIAHAADLQRLSRLRSELRQQVLASPFMDGRRFASHFKDALTRMYQEWNERQDGA